MRSRDQFWSSRESTPDILLSILEEHRYVSRLLDIVEDDLVPPTTGALLSIFRYMTSVSDLYHHPKEEIVFGRVADYDSTLEDIITGIGDEHANLHRVGHQILADLNATEKHQSVKFVKRLRAETIQYATRLRRHMLVEESQIIPRAMEILNEGEWGEIAKSINPVNDPIFGATTKDDYASLFRSYLRSVKYVSSGRVPLSLFELPATILERSIYTSIGLARLPSKLASKGKIRFVRYRRHLRQLSSSSSPSDRKEMAIELIADLLHAPKEYGDVIADTLLASGHEAKEKILQDRKSRSANEAIWERTAGISWQASITNLLLRASIKPMVTALDPENTIRVKRAARVLLGNGFQTHFVPVKNDWFKARWLESDKHEKVILYLPGGGFFLPATMAHLSFLEKLANENGASALLVDYRLAPEHPFPAGLEDALSAYQYLLDEGYNPQDIVVAGDSAGGGLVLSLLQALRSDDLPCPAGAVLLSAFTDLGLASFSHETNRWRDPMMSNGLSTSLFRDYTGGNSEDHPWLSPINGDFKGFPPIFAQVGSTEVLLDDTLHVAQKARSQGVDFQVEVWGGMPHVWQLLSFIPESKKARESLNAFVKTRWQVPQDVLVS